MPPQTRFLRNPQGTFYSSPTKLYTIRTSCVFTPPIFSSLPISMRLISLFSTASSSSVMAAYRLISSMNVRTSPSECSSSLISTREYNTTLGRTGNNLNQIAKRMNATGNIYAADVKEVKELMKKVWDTQKAMLSKQPYMKL